MSNIESTVGLCVAKIFVIQNCASEKSALSLRNAEEAEEETRG